MIKKKEIQYILHMIKCVLAGKKPTAQTDLDFDFIVDFVCAHHIEGLLAHELLQSSDNISPQKLAKLQKQYMADILLDTKQSICINEITAAFEKNNIKFLFLKGTILKNIYPESIMRKNTDIDIYVFKECIEKAKEVLTGLGFEDVSKGHNTHYNFLKDNMVLVELHHLIINPNYFWSIECQSIVNRLELVSGQNFQYQMQHEDYFLYMLAHMAKHIRTGGAGIKFVTDIVVFKNKYKDSLDYNILKTRLTEAGLYKFYTMVDKVIAMWFNDVDEPSANAFSDYILSNNWIGTSTSAKNAKFAENSSTGVRYRQLSFYLKAAFLPYSGMCVKYSVLKKIPILLPFFWIYRAFNALLNSKKRVKNVINAGSNFNLSDVMSANDFFNELGLVKKK